MTIETNILSAKKVMGCIVVLVSYYVIDVVNVFCILIFFLKMFNQNPVG